MADCEIGAGNATIVPVTSLRGSMRHIATAIAVGARPCAAPEPQGPTRPPVAIDDPQIPACFPVDHWGGGTRSSRTPRRSWRGIDPGWNVVLGGCSPLANDSDSDRRSADPGAGRPAGARTGPVAPRGLPPVQAGCGLQHAPGRRDRRRLDLRRGHPTGSRTAQHRTASYRFWVAPVNDPPSFTPGDEIVTAYLGDGEVSVPWATDVAAGPENEAHQTVLFEITDLDVAGVPNVFGGRSVDRRRRRAAFHHRVRGGLGPGHRPRPRRRWPRDVGHADRMARATRRHVRRGDVRDRGHGATARPARRRTADDHGDVARARPAGRSRPDRRREAHLGGNRRGLRRRGIPPAGADRRWVSVSLPTATTRRDAAADDRHDLPVPGARHRSRRERERVDVVGAHHAAARRQTNAAVRWSGNGRRRAMHGYRAVPRGEHRPRDGARS